MENVQEAKKRTEQRPLEQGGIRFARFDRASFMFVRTVDGVTLYNRISSMLGAGHLPSGVALRLYEDFGVRLSLLSQMADDPERDRAALQYFAGLVIPADAVSAPSIFDCEAGEC